MMVDVLLKEREHVDATRVCYLTISVHVLADIADILAGENN